MHLAESKEMAESLRKKYGLSEVELLERIGLLKDINILAAHCIHLSDDEMRVLAQSNIKTVYSPISNMKLGVGVARINQLLKHGVTIGLGTNGPASNNSLDMFETMKVASLLQKVSCLDPTILPAEMVLRMATIEGARALGLGTRIGSIEVGKQADIILMDFAQPHLVPVHDITLALFI